MNSLYVCDNFKTNNGWGTLAYNKIIEDSKKYKILFLAANDLGFNQKLPINSEFIANLPAPNNKLKNFSKLITSFFKIYHAIYFKSVVEINILSEPYFYLALFFPKKIVNFYLIGTHCLGPKYKLGKFLYQKSLKNTKSIKYISIYTLKKFYSIHKINLNFEEFIPKFLIPRCDYIKKSQRENLLIVVGEIKPRKGHDIIIESLKIFKEKNNIDNFKCLFVGSYNSAYASELILKINEYNLVKNIFLTNHISDRNLVNSLIQNSICSAVISTERDGHFEGFGVVHIESNFLFTWPIGVKDSGNSTAIIDSINGSLLPISDPQILAIELLKFFKMSEIKYYSKVRVAREYSINKYGRFE
jgi:glycosyltransferase involved in cell wall biosynthesis